MPEGDSAWWVAGALDAALVGDPLVHGRVRGVHRDLRGARVVAVRAVGKHVLIELDGPERPTLRVHLGLSGAWRIRPSPSRPPTRAGLALVTPRSSAVCFDPAQLELAPRAALLARRPIARLGPDVMVAPLPLRHVVARARARAADAPVVGALLDQSIAAGIGNICALEALHRAGIAPALPVSALDDPALSATFDLAAALLRRGVARGTGRGRPPRRVYGRTGRPCARCGGRVAFTPHGPAGRRCFWCPGCQRDARVPDVDATGPTE